MNQFRRVDLPLYKNTVGLDILERLHPTNFGFVLFQRTVRILCFEMRYYRNKKFENVFSKPFDKNVKYIYILYSYSISGSKYCARTTNKINVS